MKNSPPPPATLRETVFRDLPAKLALGPLTLVVFMGVYVWLQHRHLGVRAVVTPDWADQLIPFHPVWAWPYMLLFPLMQLATLSLGNRRELLGWLAVSLLMALPAWLAFYYFQTEYPRPLLVNPPWPYSGIVKFDAPVNVTPCLHSAFVLFSAATIDRTLKRCGTTKVARGIIWGLALLVVLGIVGTRQHRVVDILWSLPLAATGWWGFRRWADPRSYEATNQLTN